jgi:hypothetical protein
MYCRLMVFAFVALCAACNSNTTDTSTQADTATEKELVVDSAAIKAIAADQLEKTGSPYLKITSSTELQVLKFSKQTDTGANFYPNYAQACEKWTLTAPQVVQILRTSKELWGEELIQLYQELPCTYTGTLTINGKVARFEINAGATTKLIFKDSTVHLGYAKADFQKFFLEGQQEP